MALFSTGLSLTYHLAHIVLNVINASISSFYSCLCGAPQGSVLGPLLFIMYTSSLSTIISSLSLNHRLHADDTHFFFLFICQGDRNELIVTLRHGLILFAHCSYLFLV